MISVLSLGVLLYGLYGFVARQIWVRGVNGAATPTNHAIAYWLGCFGFTLGGGYVFLSSLGCF